MLSSGLAKHGRALHARRSDEVLIRRLFIVIAVLAAAALSFACGDDDDVGDGIVVAELDSAEDYFDNIQEVNEEAAAEIRRISDELEGAARYEAAAQVFKKLADDADDFDPARETIGVHEAYIFMGNLLSETLGTMAEGEEPESDLETLQDDFEFLCRDFVDVARTLFAEGREFDCDYAYTLTE